MEQRIRRRDMKVEYPPGTGYYRQIPTPPLSTLSFKCPACGTGINTWCYPERYDDDDDSLNCPERVEMYFEVFNRYVESIMERRFSFPAFVNEDKEIVEKVIKEVEEENERRTATHA